MRTHASTERELFGQTVTVPLCGLDSNDFDDDDPECWECRSILGLPDNIDDFLADNPDVPEITRRITS